MASDDNEAYADLDKLYPQMIFEQGRDLAKEKSQANKGIRWMPRRSAAKKDAASCEKPWGAAGTHRTMDLRMGQPGGKKPVILKRKPDPAN